MNALEAASLVMIPSGYEDGTLGSLKPTDGTGDFTFTRGSNISATRVNADGNIEKGYENLLLQSNSFLTSPWSRYQSILTSGEVGYDGSSDAWKIQSNGAGLLSQSVSNQGVSVCSFYAKSGTTNWVKIRLFGDTTTYSNFDLNPDTTGSRIGTSVNIIEAKTEDVGNGWFRCTILTNITLTSIRFQVMSGDNIDGVAGDNIYIQDAMLNQGLVAYPYLETTTAPVAGGILEDMPRLDYSGSCPALLLEPQRTNLFTQSEYFGDSSWAKFNCTILTNTTSTLSPTGYYSASKIQENTATNSHGFGSANTQSNSGEQITFSAFIKAAERSWATLRLYNGTTSIFAYYNLTDGTLGDIDAGGNATIVSIGNGWYRCSLTITMNSSSANYPYIFIATENGVAIYEGTNGSGIYVYGLQFEQDATYPTSYIPTYGVSQTRLADDLELPSLSSVFDSSGDYTILFEVERLAATNESQFLYIRSSSFNYITLTATSGGKCEIVLFDGATGASALTPTNSFVTGNSIKIAVKISGNNCSAFANGAELTLSLANTIPRGFDRYQNNRNHLKHQEVYIPTALSDEACIELTTI